MVEMRAGIPLYRHPVEDPGLWRRCLQSPDVSVLVVNVDSGPGSTPDAAHRDALLDREDGRVPGSRVHGYVPMDYGRRAIAEIVADVRRWQDLYGVESIFLDCAPSAVTGTGVLDHPAAASFERVVGAVRSAGASRVSANPGTLCHPALLDLCDAVCVRECDVETHLRLDPPGWLSDGDAGDVWHLIHGCRPDQVAAVVRRSRELGATLLGVSPGSLPHPWGEVGWFGPTSRRAQHVR